MLPATADAIAAALAAASVDASTGSDTALGTVVRIESACAERALEALRCAGFDMLVDLFASDTGDAIELTWHLRRLTDLETLFVKAAVVYDGEAPSVWRVFPAALFPEREAAELFGMSFAGHPNPKRLLTTDEVEVPLMRKSVSLRTHDEVGL